MEEEPSPSAGPADLDELCRAIVIPKSPPLSGCPSPGHPSASLSDTSIAGMDEALIFQRFAKNGRLNRAEYKAFLSAIGVWGKNPAYSDAMFPWTWRALCENLGADNSCGLDLPIFARRYEGRSELLQAELARVLENPATEPGADWAQEVYCERTHLMPIVPWSAGAHNPQGYESGWLCDTCGRSCSDAGAASSFA